MLSLIGQPSQDAKESVSKLTQPAITSILGGGKERRWKMSVVGKCRITIEVSQNGLVPGESLSC
jgi:hypothetical protein